MKFISELNNSTAEIVILDYSRLTIFKTTSPNHNSNNEADKNHEPKSKIQ